MKRWPCSALSPCILPGADARMAPPPMHPPMPSTPTRLHCMSAAVSAAAEAGVAGTRRPLRCLSACSLPPSMGQKVAKPRQLQQAPDHDQHARHSAGLVPRNHLARTACNIKRVRRLIKQGRLGPCWAPLQPGEGAECPVCMEHYSKLNHSACCHQDICTECFISIVAPSGGLASRCPYCQALGLQVYLPPPGFSSGAPSPAATSGAGAASAASGAAERHRIEPVAAQTASRVLMRMGSCDSASSFFGDGDGPGPSSSGSSSGGSAAASSQPSGSLSDLSSAERAEQANAATVEVAPSAAAAAAAAAAAGTGRACPRGKQEPPGSPSERASWLLSSPLSRGLEALADSAAEASRQQGPAVVAMMLGSDSSAPTSQAASPAPAAESASAASSHGGPPAGAPPACPEAAAAAAAAAAAIAGATAAAAPAAAAAREPESLPAVLPGPDGGPAVLLNPDGTEQLVLLSIGRAEAGQESGQQQGGGAAETPVRPDDEEAALPSYQAPATPEDERIRQAIAQADSSLLRQPRPAAAPAAAVRRDDWLLRMQQADAALRTAVARNDRQHFGSGSSS